MKNYMSENGTVTLDWFDPVLGDSKMICSFEFLQDFAMQRVLLDTPRTGEFTQNEIDEWHSAMKQLDEMDWEGAYNRVKIKRDED